MQNKSIYRTIVMLIALAFIFGGRAGAQSALPKDELPDLPSQRSIQINQVDEFVPGHHPRTGLSENSDNPQIALGQPGTAYSYERTYGVTEEGYIDDPDHLNYPYGIGLDSNGNLWVAEWDGARAIKFSPQGTHLMTIGKAGLIAGEFYSPRDVATDNDGNIWVVDTAVHRVAQYNSDGQFLMQLGISWESGTDNDHFSAPFGVAIDSNGNVYVSDGGNHRIQIFDSSGAYLHTIGVTGVSGGDNAHLNTPRHITVDNNNNLYVADRSNHRVQIFDPSHNYVATLGVSGVAGSDNNHFNWTSGVAVDANFIYVSDANNHRVQIFNRSSRTYANTLGSGPGSGNDQFNGVWDVAVDTAGNIYVCDINNVRIQKFNSALVYQHTFGTTGVPYLTDGYHYHEPVDVAIDPGGNIGIVEDEGRGHRFIKLDSAGDPVFIIGASGIADSDNAHLNSPEGVAFDSTGTSYIADTGNNRVQIFSSTGVYQATLGTGYGSGNYEFDYPSGIAVDSAGKIYVSDAGNHRVQVYNSSLVYQFTIGMTGVAGQGNQQLFWPLGVEVDTAGNIYVADAFNHRVQKYNSMGAWQMTLGIVEECGEDYDHFCEPSDVAIDQNGRIYVADRYNQRVQVFDSSGAYLATIGGWWGPEIGRMREPTGVAVDGDGNVYIADHHNQRVEKFAYGVPGWAQMNINGFGNSAADLWAIYSYNNALYVSSFGYSDGNRLHRFTNGNWELVDSGGFGDISNSGVDDFVAFNGNLYAATWTDDGSGWTNGGQIWRSPTGNSGSWTRVVNNGFNSDNNGDIKTLEVFNSQIYAGTWVWDNSIHGAEIWRSGTGNSGGWTRVASDSTFGSKNTEAIMTFQVFNNQLYVGTRNGSSGGEIWRSSDGSSWSMVSSNGFDTENNWAVISLESINGYLYAGTGNSATGGEIWRSSDGATWTKVVSAGFGVPGSRLISSMIAHDGDLYAVVGNFNSGPEVWRSATGDSGSWEKVIDTGFGSGRPVITNWDNITSIHNGSLYISTFSGGNTGGKIWVMLDKVMLPYVVR